MAVWYGFCFFIGVVFVFIGVVFVFIGVIAKERSLRRLTCFCRCWHHTSVFFTYTLTVFSCRLKRQRLCSWCVWIIRNNYHTETCCDSSKKTT